MFSRYLVFAVLAQQPAKKWASPRTPGGKPDQRSTTLPGLRDFGRLREMNNDKTPNVSIFR